MNLKKIGKVFTSKFVGTGPSSYIKKKNLPGRGFTKVEKHCYIGILVHLVGSEIPARTKIHILGIMYNF